MNSHSSVRECEYSATFLVRCCKADFSSNWIIPVMLSRCWRYWMQVSFSNPVRQSLFTHKDAAEGRKKAAVKVVGFGQLLTSVSYKEMVRCMNIWQLYVNLNPLVHHIGINIKMTIWLVIIYNSHLSSLNIQLLSVVLSYIIIIKMASGKVWTNSHPRKLSWPCLQPGHSCPRGSGSDPSRCWSKGCAFTQRPVGLPQYGYVTLFLWGMMMI